LGAPITPAWQEFPTDVHPPVSTPDLARFGIGPNLFARPSRLVVVVAGLLAARLAAAQTVDVWLTTGDRRAQLEPQSPVQFSASAASDNPVVVDETQPGQVIEGFGAAFTESSAYLLNEVAPPAVRTAVMTDLFTRAGRGIGLSFVRNPMGACDYARTYYSFDDQPAGKTDPTLAGFSIARDQLDVIPLVKLARQLNPGLTLMATPWSPPGWMKTSDSLLKGTLRPDMHRVFANYLVRYLQAYADNGLPIQYVSLQNEPLFEPKDYPGMLMDAATQTALLRDHVVPALVASQLPTRVMVYDHNWDRTDYSDQVLAALPPAVAERVAGVAWHGYGGSPGVMTTVAGKHLAFGNYQTEHSGGAWVHDQFRSDFEDIIHAMRNSSRTYLKWNLALDQRGGPVSGGGKTSTPLITIDSATGAATYGIEYFTLGHFSKFVQPGARRVFSTNGVGVLTAAFVNADGSTVLVAFNEAAGARTLQVVWGGRQFGYTLPPAGAATFVWSGRQSGGYSLDATNAIQASSFNAIAGLETELTRDATGTLAVGHSGSGRFALYRNVNFGRGVDTVSVRFAAAGHAGRLEFRLDGPGGDRIGIVEVEASEGRPAWQTATARVAGVRGIHDLCLVFSGSAENIADLNWFKFGTLPATASK